MKSLNNLECVTLFVDDLARARTFYEAYSTPSLSIPTRYAA